jgi:hypothetical protein
MKAYTEWFEQMMAFGIGFHIFSHNTKITQCGSHPKSRYLLIIKLSLISLFLAKLLIAFYFTLLLTMWSNFDKC